MSAKKRAPAEAGATKSHALEVSRTLTIIIAHFFENARTCFENQKKVKALEWINRDHSEYPISIPCVLVSTVIVIASFAIAYIMCLGVNSLFIKLGI